VLGKLKGRMTGFKWQTEARDEAENWNPTTLSQYFKHLKNCTSFTTVRILTFLINPMPSTLALEELFAT
jgi:hypothetical protein